MLGEQSRHLRRVEVPCAAAPKHSLQNRNLERRAGGRAARGGRAFGLRRRTVDEGAVDVDVGEAEHLKAGRPDGGGVLRAGAVDDVPWEADGHHVVVKDARVPVPAGRWVGGWVGG